MIRAWVNGQEASDISLRDRGFQYGDGLFETMRLEKSSIIFMNEHCARLQLGCQRLNIKINIDLILQQLDIVLKEVASGVLKLIVTRGDSERGYKINPEAPPTIIWIHSDYPVYPSSYYSEGVDVCICKTQVSRNPVLAGLKHMSRMENILARQEWQDEYQEGLMCDELGNIVEGTMSNFFAVKSDTLITPGLQYSGVEGVVRQKLLDIAAQENYRVEIRDINLAELESIDSVLMTSSLIGVWPVRSIAAHQFEMNPLSKLLVERFQGYQD